VAEAVQSIRARQDKEWSDIEQAAHGLDDGSAEIDESGYKRDVPAHWTQQKIKKRGRRDLAGQLDEIDGKTDLEQRPIHKDVVCRDGSVGKGNQPIADEALSEDAGDDHHQKQNTSSPGSDLRFGAGNRLGSS